MARCVGVIDCIRIDSFSLINRPSSSELKDIQSCYILDSAKKFYINGRMEIGSIRICGTITEDDIPINDHRDYSSSGSDC